MAGTTGPKADRTAFLALFLILLALTVTLIVASIPAGFYSVFSGRLSASVTYLTPFPLYYWVGPVSEFTHIGVGVGWMFAVLTALYVAFFVYCILQREGPRAAVAKSFRGGVGALGASPILAVMISIGFLNFGATLIDQLVSAAGAPIGGPNSSADPLALMAGFTYAPLIEELGFRVLLIGVVAFILSISRPWKDALGALWRPSRALEGFALGSGASIIIWAATGFSAVTFGACHVVCGTTWDVGKFPEAAFGGAVLGYLYVKYGFHAAVLAHWGVDFFGSSFSFFGQAAYGIPWYSSTQEYLGQYLVDLDMLFLFGLLCFVMVGYLGVRKLLSVRSRRDLDEFDKGPPGGGALGP